MSQPLASGFGMLSGLVSGGMDVLETIGKKTFEAVTVKDEVGFFSRQWSLGKFRKRERGE